MTPYVYECSCLCNTGKAATPAVQTDILLCIGLGLVLDLAGSLPDGNCSQLVSPFGPFEGQESLTSRSKLLLMCNI